MFTRTIELRRLTQIRMTEKNWKKQLQAIVAAAERNRSLGFTGKLGRMGEPTHVIDQEQPRWEYRVKLRIQKEGGRGEEVAERQFEHVMKMVVRKAEVLGWTVRVGEEASQPKQEVVQLVERASEPPMTFVAPELTQEAMDTYFHGVYERDEHIRTIHSVVQLAADTEGKILSHVLLYGHPGSCKTVLMERFKAWYDAASPGAERVLWVDGTTTTKAGLERWLLDLAEEGSLPSVLVLDEIEKQDKDNLLSLLSIMGSGIIARLNAVAGNRRAKARMVIAGICNDEEALRDWRDGALWSRFGGNKLPCVRPSKDLCYRILYEMILDIPDGKAEWGDEAMAFGWDELGQRDIREIKDHLCGRDRLLTGEWQVDRRRILAAKALEDQGLEQNAPPGSADASLPFRMTSG